MDTPKYARINPAELKEIEAEVGHSVTEEVALWFIRSRIHREAVERMLAVSDKGTAGIMQNVRNIRTAKVAKEPQLGKKCA